MHATANCGKETSLIDCTVSHISHLIPGISPSVSVEKFPQSHKHTFQQQTASKPVILAVKLCRGIVNSA